MLRIIFNKSNIESIEIPLKRSMVYSSEIKGLFCEVFKSGTKTFRVQYKLNNLKYVYTIGQYPSIHPSYAITKAKEIKRLVSEGINPQKEKSENRKEQTYREYFLNEYQKTVLNNDIGRYQKTISKTSNGHFTVSKINT